jgi:hypothetical protein
MMLGNSWKKRQILSADSSDPLRMKEICSTMKPNKRDSYFRRILSEKKRLGPIEWLSSGTSNIGKAHYALGVHVRLQVKKILDWKLSQLSSEGLAKCLGDSQACYGVLQEKIISTKANRPLACLVKRYVECLDMWSRGAGLADYFNPKIYEINSSSMCAPIILGLFLQSETIRCQTGVFKDTRDSIVLWHTEEDEEGYPGMHFDKLRIFSFRDNTQASDILISSFIYPHLMPGPAFGWSSSGYIQTVDSLYLKPRIQKKGLFSNIVTWIALLSNGRIPLSDIVAELGPYLDGNVINRIYRKGGVNAEKIEFAGSRYALSEIGKEVGSYLFQVNVFSKRESSIAKKYETTDRRVLNFMERRIRRTDRFLDKYGQNPTDIHERMRELMSSYYGDDSGYANTYVKAYLSARVDTHRTDLLIGNGPAISNDNPAHLKLVS